jgi:cytochrome c oxidase assembly factor CtaG
LSYTRERVKRIPGSRTVSAVAPGDWSWNAEALLPLALAGLYLAATRGERTTGRAVAFITGCVLLVVALVTPLDTLAREYLVWAHLVQNVGLAEWAPLLLVLGTPPALAERLTRPAIVRVLTSPFVALPLWAATYALWHVPALYDAALRHPSSLLALEHATYVVSGLAFWWCVWQDVPHRLSAIARAGYVFAAFVLSARPRARARPAAALRLLRGCARARLGDRTARGPAARRDDHGR